MGWSLTLGTVRGIRIKLHLTFLLLIPWAAYNWGFADGEGWVGAIFGVAITATLFLCVVLHELAHSLVAMQYGVHVREIELSPIGGVSKMDSMPEKPYQEFVMALSGPLVNLAIAAPLGVLVLGLLAAGSIRSLGHLAYLLGKPSWQGFILNLFISNVLLALFNLLPAFPMDGGRVLRSVLALSMGQPRATRWAVRVGQTLAILLALFGLFPPGGMRPNPILAIIGLFVFVGAQQEGRSSEVLGILSDLHVSQAVITTCQALAPEDTLESVLEHTMRGHPACFGVVEGGKLVGLLGQEDVTAALEAHGHSVRVRDVMQREFPSVSSSDSLAKAWQLMATSARRALPVIQDGQWLGMVTAQQIGQIYAFVAARQRGQRR